MQSDTLLALLGIGVGIFTGFNLQGLITSLKKYLANREFHKHAFPQKVNVKRLCKGLHGWTTTQMFNKSGVYSVKICKICGYLPETNEMVSQTSLDKIEEYNENKFLAEKLYTEFLDQEYLEIRAYFSSEIKNGLSLEKLLKVHLAGTDFNDRFNVYFKNKKEDAKKERDKGNA